MVLLVVRRRQWGRRRVEGGPPSRGQGVPWGQAMGRRVRRRRVVTAGPQVAPQIWAGLDDVWQVGGRVPGQVGGLRPCGGGCRGFRRLPLVMGGHGAVVVGWGRGSLLRCRRRRGCAVGHVAPEELLVMLLVVPQPLVPWVQPMDGW